MVALLACSSAGGTAGSPDPAGASPSTSGGAPVADPFNRGWIGGACSGAGDCGYDGAVCLAAADGFPGGTCSQRCAKTCPDREGATNTQTMCVADREGFGTCVSRCDFAKIPGKGCRDGYGCTPVSRMGEPDTIIDACMPLGADGRARALNDLQPAVERAVEKSDIDEKDARVVVMDVTAGRAPLTSGIRLLDPIYPASVIKLLLMVEAEHQIEQGKLSRTARFSVTDEEDTCDSMPDADTRPPLESGDSASVDDLVDMMITRSDNTATNVLLDHLGRAQATAYMRELGLPTLQIHKKVFGCEPYDDSGWDGVHLNTMTALETGKLYRLVLDGGPGFVGPAARTRMQEVLGRQFWRPGISATLPGDAVYLTKTGNTSEYAHDSGIISWRGRRFVVAVFLEMPLADAKPKLRAFGEEIARIMAAR